MEIVFFIIIKFVSSGFIILLTTELNIRIYYVIFLFIYFSIFFLFVVYIIIIIIFSYFSSL